jgi:hypothetical protein
VTSSVDAPFEPAEGDLSPVSLFAGWALADELARRLAGDGFAAARFADGVVFQHLVGGPLSVSRLAERMAVSRQAGSHAVALSARGEAVVLLLADVIVDLGADAALRGRRARPPR